MSIKQQIEDAAFLAQHGRHLGALTNLMLAVAASSRRALPKGTKSLERPTEEIGDREAFTQFLGGRIRRLLFGNFDGPEFATSGISVSFKGKQYDVAYILYKFYRCELVHEGELPEDIEFIPSKIEPRFGSATKGLQVSISSGDKLALDHGWINLLIEAVVQAPCNGAEFGIEHFDLVYQGRDSEESLRQTVIANYSITPGRVAILKEIVRLLSPQALLAYDDDGLDSAFMSLLQRGGINGGALTGLASGKLATYEGGLLATGRSALREMASSYALQKRAAA